MFCDEHGTPDYCGECMVEERDKEIAALRRKADALAEAVDKHIRYEQLPFGAWKSGEAVRLEKAMEAALAAYRVQGEG